MSKLELSDVYEAAAIAAVNKRCAAAYLHDVRGSMQALFSAIELLGRSAKSGSADSQRAEKAWELAKRAIVQHDRSTMAVMQALALQHSEPTAVDLAGLIRETAHFLRNDAAHRNIRVIAESSEELTMSADVPTLKTMLAGLIVALIDEQSAGAQIRIAVERTDDDAVVNITAAAVPAAFGRCEATPPEAVPVSLQDLAVFHARRYLARVGGRLTASPGDVLRLVHPLSFAATRTSETAK